jgi:hypothetical protein
MAAAWSPRPFLHPFPVETRWTNQITSFSLSCSLKLFRLLLLSSRVPLTLSLPPALPPSPLPSRPSPPLSLSLSLSLLLFSLCYSTIGFSPRLSCCRRIIPHIIEHRAQERKTPRLSLRAVPLVPIRPVPVCGFQLKRRSYEGLRETLRRLFLE